MARYIVEVAKSYVVEADDEDEAFTTFMSNPLEDFECVWDEVTATYPDDLDGTFEFDEGLLHETST